MIDRWVFGPAPATRLATLRILIGAFALVYLVIRAPVLLAMGDISERRWEPVGVLSWIDAPLSGALVDAAVLITILLGMLFTLGVAFRATGPLFAVSLLLVTTYRASWGQLLWFDNLMVIHVLIVGFSAAAEVYAVGRTRPAGVADHSRFGWPVRLAAIVTVASYALAGFAKLRIAGTAWTNGESLRHHIAYSATRLRVLGGTPSPLAAPLMNHLWLMTPLAVATLVIELGAPAALFLARLRRLWVAAAVAMHAAIAAAMFVVFPYPLTMIAFAPLFDLERLIPWCATRCRPLRRRTVRCRG